MRCMTTAMAAALFLSPPCVCAASPLLGGAPCDAADVARRTVAINDACCAASLCTGGVPLNYCSADCAEVFLPFWGECGSELGENSVGLLGPVVARCEATVAAGGSPSPPAGRGALPPTVQIAPGVVMPRINLGTCCGSKVANAFPAWYNAGGRGVDTAFDYGKEVPGGKETDLHKAIVRSGAPRSSLFITTKIRAGLDVLHGGKFCIGLNAKYALDAVKADLAELNVTQVDLVLLHAPCNSDATNAKLWKGMEQALASNLTRSIGVSNYPKKQLAALLAQATTKPAVNQCQMSMANQETEMLQYCAEQGIVFEACEYLSGPSYPPCPALPCHTSRPVSHWPCCSCRR